MRNFIEGIGRLRERRRRAVWVSSDQQWVIVGALRRFSASTSFSTRRRGREFVCSDRSMPSTRDCTWPTCLWTSIRVPRTQSDTARYARTPAYAYARTSAQGWHRRKKLVAWKRAEGMADSEGGSEQDDVSFLRTVSLTLLCGIACYKEVIGFKV